MTREQFLQKTGLTEDQFYGRVKIRGTLDLDSLTFIPEGLNPTNVKGRIYILHKQKTV